MNKIVISPKEDNFILYLYRKLNTFQIIFCNFFIFTLTEHCTYFIRQVFNLSEKQSNTQENTNNVLNI